MSVVLRETVNTIRVNYLLDTYTFNDFYETWTGTKLDAKNEYNKTMKYLASKLDPINDVIKYNYCKGRNDGRMIGEKSIQNCKREIRGFLCDKLTTDIDIANCHPVLLLHICDKHNIECPNLKEYCNNRNECLERIMDGHNCTWIMAKKKILVSTNWNKKMMNPYCQFFCNYDKEMKIIQKKLLDINEYNYIKEFAKKDTNFTGSFINHILCIEENKILQFIIQYVESCDSEIHSLMFDGLQIYGDISEGYLKDIQDNIREKSENKSLCLTIKDHEYSFRIPKDYNAKKLIKYGDIKADFEKNNCKVGHLFVNEMGDGEINIYKKAEFTILHEELIFMEDRKEKSFNDEWYKDSEKRKFIKFDSFPKQSLCPDNVYNLFKPFPVENIKIPDDLTKECEEALQYFLNHILILCDNDEKMYDFVCMWISQMFQYPEHKSIELVFISKEGAGKGLFLKFLQTIMGGDKRCWETTDPQKDIYGAFNPCMKEAFLVICNEANKSNIYNATDKKKALITDPYININIKNVSSFSMRSYHRFLTFSNNPAPTQPSKRRDAIIRSSDELIDNVEYFDKGWVLAENITFAKYIYDYFMKFQTKPKIRAVDIPISDYHKIMIEEHKSVVEKFLEDKCTKWNDNKIELKEYPCSDFYNKFRYYCNDNNIDNTQSPTGFGMKLTFMGLKSIRKDIKKIEGKTTNVILIDVKLLFKELKLQETE